MKTSYHENIDLPYTSRQMFDLVIDVRSYPEFLPWCQRLRITREGERDFYAELMVGFKGFSGKFVSHVEYDPETLNINVYYKTGPLKYLETKWCFSENEEGCHVEFFIDFEFKSSLFQSMTSFFFRDITSKMMTSFVERAHVLYGKDSLNKAMDNSFTKI